MTQHGTGEGLIDLRDPNALDNWSMERIQKYSYLQQRMLVSGFKLLRPRGIMVYSTCTFSPEENEKPVSFLLKKFPSARLEPIDINIPGDVLYKGLCKWQGQCFDKQLERAIRIKPNNIMEGFFVAKILKNENTS